MVIHTQSANCSAAFTGLINSIWHFNCSWFGYSKVFNVDFQEFLSLRARRNEQRWALLLWYVGLFVNFVCVFEIVLKSSSSPKILTTGIYFLMPLKQEFLMFARRTSHLHLILQWDLYLDYHYNKRSHFAFLSIPGIFNAFSLDLCPPEYNMLISNLRWRQISTSQSFVSCWVSGLFNQFCETLSTAKS